MTPPFLSLAAQHPACIASQQMDNTLKQLLVHTPSLCLVATGGYGRGALAPSSDIDILFLHEAPLTKAEENAIRTTLHTLWDAGFTLGHAVRTVAETLALAATDHITCTSLLDMRHVAGNAGRHTALASQFAAQFSAQRKSFFAEKHAELLARHKAQRDKPAGLLKSPGGLRDLQTLYWLQLAAESPAPLPEASAAALTEHHTLLWDMRCAIPTPEMVESIAPHMQRTWQQHLAPAIMRLGALMPV